MKHTRALNLERVFYKVFLWKSGVVRKNVDATTPKDNMGYDQYTVP